MTPCYNFGNDLKVNIWSIEPPGSLHGDDMIEKISNFWQDVNFQCQIAETNANKHKSYLLKWSKIDNQLRAYN